MLAYPGAAEADCLHQEFLVNDGGATTVSVRQVPLIEDSPGELDRVLGDLVGPGPAAAGRRTTSSPIAA